MFTSLILSSLTAITVLSNVAFGALVKVPDFGTPVKESKLEMFIYVPAKLAPNPAIVMDLHGCMGSAAMSQFASKAYFTAADQKGFIMIVPQTTADRNCWDVGTPKSLKHDGLGDTHVLATMIKYTLEKYKGDKDRVFVTGTSSGAMMTNVMCAVYPDLIAGGAAFSGVAAFVCPWCKMCEGLSYPLYLIVPPRRNKSGRLVKKNVHTAVQPLSWEAHNANFSPWTCSGCFDHSKSFNPIDANRTCTDGKVHKTGAEWAAQVRSFYPGYTGKYPIMSIWHGTADNLIVYASLKEMMLEWSEIHNVKFTRNETNSPQSGYTKMVYGDGKKLVGYSAQGVGHVVPQHGKEVMEFWGL